MEGERMGRGEGEEEEGGVGDERGIGGKMEC